jgi:predicted enzyme related to lactoylglutathione lyase
MARVVHFEIHAENPERAAAFYRKVFDWQITKWDGPADYWPITTGPDSEPGINGAILQRQGPINGDSVIAYVCTIGVADIDETIARATAEGATEALPKMAVPGIGWLAYFKDSEGNIFGILQPDGAAV